VIKNALVFSQLFTFGRGGSMEGVVCCLVTSGWKGGILPRFSKLLNFFLKNIFRSEKKGPGKIKSFGKWGRIPPFHLQ
jgi:hypothetical protein